MKQITLIIGCCILSSIRSISQEGKESAILNWSMAANPMKVDVGKILQGEVKAITISLSNEALTGNQTILKVETSCSCISPKLSKLVLRPRESADLSFDLVAGFTQHQIREMIVIQYANSATNDIGTLQIPIIGSVDSVVEVAPRRIDCSISSFESSPSTHSLQVKRGTSDVAWTDLKIRVVPEQFLNICSFDKTEQGVFNIVFTENKSVLNYGVNRGWIAFDCLTKNGDKVFEEKIPLVITVDHPLKVEPNFLYLDDLASGEFRELHLRLTALSGIVNMSSIRLEKSNEQSYECKTWKKISPNEIDVTIVFKAKSDGLIKCQLTFSYKADRSGEINIPIVAIVKNR